jgi:hypothetical protein
MFEDLTREIRRLEGGVEFRVPIEADRDGYIDKECPAGNCQFQFKVHGEDWLEKFKDDEVFCPYCGHSAASNAWFTTEQVEHAEAQALKYVEGTLGEALRQDAESFNRIQPEHGFITMSMEVHGTRAQRTVIPAPADELFELKITCGECSSRWSVIGSAFFCPCCGHSSAERVFEQALAKIRVKVNNDRLIEDKLIDAVGRDQARVIVRSLVETGLVDCVVAFQRLAEQLYSGLPGAPRSSLNAFQRLDDGSSLWLEQTGYGYDHYLSSEELRELKLFFGRRHILSHTDGIVDERYLSQTQDASYRAGQRLVVTSADVRTLADLVEKLGLALRRAVASVRGGP